MKKSTLALSIAAAIGSFGLAGTASAAMEVNTNGVGHQLVFPYFTAQGDNATLLNITNTDTVNGKLVKVRFRGAANSDDLFDFQVLLSPGDVWTAAVSKDATTGLAKLATTDKSCTLPASVNMTFSTSRLDPSASDDAKANGTREGYVEVINMGDIDFNTYSAMDATAKATSLYKAVKHVSGVAPCTAAVLEAKLGSAFTTPNTEMNGITKPTGGLIGDWIILNQANTAAWSGSATAIKASGTTQVVFWPQKSGNVTVASDGTATSTADLIFVKGILTAQNFDLPDLSTVYETAGSSFATTAVAQANDITTALAVKSITNQFVTSDSIAGVTDFLFSQPTRRYHVAVNYKAQKDNPDVAGTGTTDLLLSTKGTDAVAIYRDTTNGSTSGSTFTAGVAGGSSTLGSSGSSFYNSTNMAFPTGSRTLCLKSVSTPGQNDRFDREETTPGASTTDFTISPVVPAATSTVYVCGEAAVLSINNAGTVGDSALSASVARNDITFVAGYEDGWMRFATDGTGNTSGLPILGASFIRMANGAVNYGVSYSHKVTR